MTAELCDIFPDRLTGARIILNECKKIKFKTFYILGQTKYLRNYNQIIYQHLFL